MLDITHAQMTAVTTNFPNREALFDREFAQWREVLRDAPVRTLKAAERRVAEGLGC